MSPGDRVIIGKSQSLKGTVHSVSNSLVQVVIDGHKKPSCLLASSLALVPRDKPKRVSRKSILQPSLSLDPVEQWRDKFIAQYGERPDCDPLDLLGRRYADPHNRTLLPNCPKFDFERFQGFGHFLVWLDSQHRSSKALCQAADLHT